MAAVPVAGDTAYPAADPAGPASADSDTSALDSTAGMVARCHSAASADAVVVVVVTAAGMILGARRREAGVWAMLRFDVVAFAIGVAFAAVDVLEFAVGCGRGG